MSVKYFDKEKNEWIVFPGLGGNSGNADFSEISASIGTVVETDNAMASVNFEDKNFEFSFGFPKGIKGDKGDKGDPGESAVSARTVLAFTTSDTKPARPVGGSWDVLTNEITLPEGWSMSDEIAKPVWMCSGIFYNEDPNNPIWGDTSLISGADGDNGADGTSVEFIYKLTPDHTDIYKPERPTQNTQTDVAPDGWTDSPSGISEEMQCEWFCTRKWTDNGWSDWEGPYIWSKWGANGLDGDGVQYVYYLNDGEPVSNPTISDYATNDAYQERGAYDGVEYCPASPWTDEPSGVTPDNKCEWVSVRKFRDGKWGPYSDPKLWARYGETGASGLISRSKYAITDSSSVVPAFNKMDKNPGSIWYSTLESAMMHYEYPQAMWSITAYFDRNNEFAEFVDEDGNSIIGWQGPIIISGTKGDQGPIGPQGIQGEAGATGPEGPNGPMGVAGVGMEFRYCRGTSDAPEYPSVEDITYGADSKDNGKATPDGWHWNTENMVLEGDYLYVWCIQGKKKYNDDKDNYSIDWQAAFRLSGLNGSEKGDQGEAGPVVYPAGYWNENKIYEIKNGLCPYVYYEGNFYILNATPSINNNPEEYPKIWVKMESFEAIYADVGVFKQALVGSAVFHGDYVYSQQGVDGDYTDATIDPIDGSLSDFTPNILFDFSTGEGHLAGGKLKWYKLNDEWVLSMNGTSGDPDGNGLTEEEVKELIKNSVDNIKGRIDNVENELDNKADSSDIPNVSNFVTKDQITQINNKIDNIEVGVSADYVATAIGEERDYISTALTNGDIKISGSSISENAIAAEHISSNVVTAIAVEAGDIVANNINAGEITLRNYARTEDLGDLAYQDSLSISGSDITGGEITGLTIKSNDNENPAWSLNQDGSGRLANGQITWKTDGTVELGNKVNISWKDDLESSIANANANSDAANQAVSGLSSKLTKIDADGVYTGNISANKIKSGTFIGVNSVGDKKFRLDAEGGHAEFSLGSGYDTHFYGGGTGQIAGGLISWGKNNDGIGYVTFKTVNGVSIASKSDLSSVQKALTQSINNKATVDDVMEKLRGSAEGETQINGGWIDTSAITVRSSNLVDDDDNPVTIITDDTLSTTNVYAEYLKVNALNIEGKLTADKIDTKGLSTPEVNCGLDSEDPNIPYSSIYLGEKGISIVVGETSFIIDKDGIKVQDSKSAGVMKLWEYVLHQYHQDNYTINETNTTYKYTIESTSHGISFDLISGSTNTVNLPYNDEVIFALDSFYKNCVTPINYKNGIPHNGETVCDENWTNPLERSWTVRSSGGVVAHLNENVLYVKRTSSDGKVYLRCGTMPEISFNVIE